MCFVTYPCEVLSQWDEKGHRAKDLLGLHFRGEHHEFTQLHHVLNLKQKGTVSQDCHSKLDDEKFREENLLDLNNHGELHHALNLKQKGSVSQDYSSSPWRALGIHPAPSSSKSEEERDSVTRLFFFSEESIINSTSSTMLLI
jgi:hypothetical protein